MTDRSTMWGDVLTPSPYGMCVDNSIRNMWDKYVTSVQNHVTEEGLHHLLVLRNARANETPSMILYRLRERGDYAGIEKEVRLSNVSKTTARMLTHYFLNGKVRFKTSFGTDDLPFKTVIKNGYKRIYLDKDKALSWLSSVTKDTITIEHLNLTAYFEVRTHTIQYIVPEKQQ